MEAWLVVVAASFDLGVEEEHRALAHHMQGSLAPHMAFQVARSCAVAVRIHVEEVSGSGFVASTDAVGDTFLVVVVHILVEFVVAVVVEKGHSARDMGYHQVLVEAAIDGREEALLEVSSYQTVRAQPNY